MNDKNNWMLIYDGFSSMYEAHDAREIVIGIMVKEGYEKYAAKNELSDLLNARIRAANQENA